MSRNRNAFLLLRDKELGIRGYMKQNHKVIRRLVCEEKSRFRQVWVHHSNKTIAYEGGRIYTDNYRTCYTIYGHQGLPQVLYTLPACPATCKIEDCLTCECPLSNVCLECKGYRPFMLALTADNWLVRYDLDTGQVLQRLFLSSKHKFRHLSWETHGHTVVVKSTQSKVSSAARQAGFSQNVLLALAVFSIFPLKFKGMVEITKEVFGVDVKDAIITQGTLITMHQGGWVRLHSWERVMEQAMVSPVDSVSTPDHDPSSGLPVTVRLKVSEAVPVLFEVRCADHSLSIGGIPWHYIITPYGSSGNFHLYSVRNKKLADCGSLDMETLSLEPDKCLFHSDDSGRVLHIGANEVRVLRIKESDPATSGDTSEYRLNREFTVKMCHSGHRGQQQQSAACYTSSGRAVKRTNSFEDIFDSSLESIQSVDDENDLDLLVVTSVHQRDGDEGFEACIQLHDNQSGELIKVCPLEEAWNEIGEHTVCVDLDVIVHIVKAPKRKTCYLYRLDRMEDKGAKQKALRSSSRSSSRSQQGRRLTGEES